jgi:DNA invertase Pin-like site-specific DNA recombinase
MRTALYIRFSSQRQIHGTSLKDQLARLRTETLACGEKIVAEYIDQARSGATAARRKEYQRLLADAQAKKFDRVRVESVDRGHRNDFDRRTFEQEMARLGISVLYLGEPEQQAPEYRKFQRGIKGLVAELESDAASQRTYKRQLYRANRGQWRGGIPPYGLKPDGDGWFESDPDSYDVLLWILSCRAEGNTYHAITRLLNEGISINGAPPTIPPTPGVLAYQRKPYLEQQDPETGDVLRLPRKMPSAAWKVMTVRRICTEAVDGFYAGVYHWGSNYNRFAEDGDGKEKAPVRIDTGKPLIPDDLLRRVQAVELAVRDDSTEAAIIEYNSFLLDLRCGRCGEALHGYTSTKYKEIKKTGETRPYKYRKYRCAGRANRTGSCTMPMLSADKLEHAVLEAVFNDTRQRRPELLAQKLREAAERRRLEIQQALNTLDQEMRASARRRDDALDAITDRTLSAVVRDAMARRVEEAVEAYTEMEGQQRTLQRGLEALDAQLRTAEIILTSPLLDPARWQEPAISQILKRALHLLVHRAELQEQKRGTYRVKLWLYREEFLLFRENVSFESAWGSNPPTRLVTPPTGFEDQGSHRATSALVSILAA